MQFLKTKKYIYLMAVAAFVGMNWNLAVASDCSTPDSNSPISTCYFDLTTSPSSTDPAASTVSPVLLNGGIFQVPGQSNQNIVGTGVLNPFVRIQEQANGTQWKKGTPADGVESGFNTSAKVKRTSLLDDHDNGGSNWNHAIRLGDLCKVTVGNADYYQFSLDINEQGNTKYSDNSGLSMDEFKLFYSDSSTIDTWHYTDSNNDPSTGFSSFQLDGANLAYDMDGALGGDASILMDYRNFSGSGRGIDLQALVPVTNFAGATANSYVYLYSTFGATKDKCLNPTDSNGNITGDSTCMTPDGSGGDKSISPASNPTKAGSLSMVADAGFEEWSMSCKYTGCNHTVPEPETLALVGLGFLGMVATRRRGGSA